MLGKLDVWLLGKTERGAQWFQKMTGLNNFWLAKQTIFLETISCILSTVTFAYMPASLVGSGFMFKLGLYILGFLGVLVAIALPIRLIAMSLQEQRIEREILNGHSNSEKINPASINERALQLFKTVVIHLLIMIYFGVSQFTLLVSMFYFLGCIWRYLSACDPLPHGKSKIKTWIESFRKAPAAQPIAT